ncbi:hypothetical protein ACFPRL_24680 [Pseudoclavibacter helvolus]
MGVGGPRPRARSRRIEPHAQALARPVFDAPSPRLRGALERARHSCRDGLPSHFDGARDRCRNALDAHARGGRHHHSASPGRRLVPPDRSARAGLPTRRAGTAGASRSPEHPPGAGGRSGDTAGLRRRPGGQAPRQRWPVRRRVRGGESSVSGCAAPARLPRRTSEARVRDRLRVCPCRSGGSAVLGDRRERLFPGRPRDIRRRRRADAAERRPSARLGRRPEGVLARRRSAPRGVRRTR